MKNYKILFIGKKSDKFSIKYYLYLKKNFRYVSVIYNNLVNHEQIKHRIKSWRGHYILCFRSNYLIKKNEIKKASKNVINFHPGPPQYRGIGCVNFAIMNNEKIYGSTAHLIDSDKIDNGKIVDVVLWKIKKNSSIDKILIKTYEKQFYQFKRVVKYIKKNNLEFLIKKNKNYKWSKKLYTKNDLNDLYLIDANIKKNYLKKILKSTITEKFKPYVLIHGQKFVYEN
jgi:methionyl-tRNA formyltransferase